METEYSEEFLRGLTSMSGVDKGKCFYALIGGSLFKSGTGKILFQKKGPLLVALNHRLQYRVSNRVYKQLTDKGYTHDRIVRDRGYQNAWDDFKAWALETGFIQIKEIEIK